MPNKFYSLPKSVFEYYHNKLKTWVMSVLPTKTSDLTNDSDFLDQLALAGIVASNFSTSSTYAVGDYVLYNHTLYRCKTAISTAGVWDSSKWDATKTQDIFQGSAPGLVPAAESGDADKVLKGDGTWGEAGSSVRVSYDSVTEELHMDFSPIPTSVEIGGRNYPVVRIGNQLWIAENLDYKFTGLTIRTDTSGLPSGDYAWYYDNDESTYGVNGNKYGLLYNMSAVHLLEDNKATLLPDGWHVPSRSELETLINSCGGFNNLDKLRSVTGWTNSPGTDTFGFNAKPSGYWSAGSHDLGIVNYIASCTYRANIYTYFLMLSATDPSFTDDYVYPAMSIRLVKTLT